MIIKRLPLLLLIFLSVLFQNSTMAQNNFDFSAKAPSGQTLYYKLINNDTGVEVVKPEKNLLTLKDYQPKGNIIIPDAVEYMGVKFPVVRIGTRAFYACSSITSVTIPISVREIGWCAFEETSLTKIELPNSLERIGMSAFKRTPLTEIVIPESVISIGEEAFSGCDLRKVVVLCKYASNGKDIFKGCNKVEEAFCEQYLGIPKSNLKRITFGEDVTSIPKFQNCDFLEKVVIGNNVKNIPEDCFDDCDNLRTVVFGSRVTHIGDRAFRKCVSLDTIYAKRTYAPELGINVFNFTPTSKVVVINCQADYSSIWGTEGFNYTTPNIYTLTLGVNNLSCGSSSFVKKVDCNNTAIIEATPFENYKFEKWSDGNTSNPRTITLTKDIALDAVFVRSVYYVTAKSNNNTMGSVAGAGKYNVGDRVTLTANAICGYRFNHWSNGSKDNPITFFPHNDTNMTAYFEIALDTIFVPDTTIVKVIIYDTTIVNVPIFDTMCFRNPDILMPKPEMLLMLQDTINLCDYDSVVSDNRQNSGKVYVNNGCIIVEGIHSNNVMLYDSYGHMMALRKNDDEVLRFEVPISGVYTLKIDNRIIQNVVVIK